LKARFIGVSPRELPPVPGGSAVRVLWPVAERPQGYRGDYP